KHLYHELYHLSKGNTFKHKRALVEHVSYSGKHHDLQQALTEISRFTRLRLRSNVSVSSRSKWTPSARRTSKLARESLPVNRRRETPFSARPPSSRRESSKRRILFASFRVNSLFSFLFF